MNPRFRRILVAAAIAMVPLLVAGWSVEYLADQREVALASERAAAECRAIVQRIRSARKSQPRGVTEAAPQVAFTRRLTDAAATAGIPPANLERIEHDAPHRSDTDSTLQKPSRVQFRAVTLRQLAVFLDTVDPPSEGVTVGYLHLTTPRSAPDPYSWNADATFITTEEQVSKTR
jgi:hypothetical protein